MKAPLDQARVAFAETQPPASAAAQPQHAVTRHANPFIYIACPVGPKGGGMYKVADYLVQAQAAHKRAQSAELRLLDTRGSGSALASLWVLLTALFKLARGRVGGNLVGVHVNMAEKLSLFRKGSVVIAARALGVPVVIHLHAQMQGFYRRLPAPLRAAMRWMYSLAACVLVIGPAGRRFVTEELGVAPERVHIIINGVPGRVDARPPAPADAVRRVLYIGRLSGLKGVPDLLQAVGRLGADRAGMKLTLAGEGDIDGCRATARALEIEDAVSFEGWCDQAKIHRLLRESDILVLPSYDEVMPLVILEALAYGVAVICTPVGEVPSVLTDGQDACFVTPGDVDQLAAALRLLLQHPQRREALQRNGQALYLDRFSIARFFDNVARIHQRYFGLAAAPASRDRGGEAAG
jgi:glycosyltransferase involved in cell wall biosynthesis